MNIIIISRFFAVITIVCFSFSYTGAQALEINNDGHLIQKYADGSFKFVEIHEIKKDFLKTIDTKIVQNYFLSRANDFVEYINESKKNLEIQMLYDKSELDDLYLNIEDIDEENTEKYKLEIKLLKIRKKENIKLLDSIKDFEDEAKGNLNLVKNFKLKNVKKMASSINKYLKNEITEEEWKTIDKTKYTYKEILKDGFIANKIITQKEFEKDSYTTNKTDIKDSKSERSTNNIENKSNISLSEEKVNKDNISTSKVESTVITLKKTVDIPISISTHSYTIIPTNREYAKPKQKENLISNPPKYVCPIIFDDIDELTGKKRKDLATEIIFTYTPENLKRIMKHDDYMICSGHMSKLTGGYRFLFIEVKIKSRNAKIEYGRLEKGNFLNLKLLNGKNYKIRSGVSNDGIFNAKTGYTTYKTQYKLTSDLYSKLKESPLDKIRIVWSTGYEDYEVYSIDFLINQLNCL